MKILEINAYANGNCRIKTRDAAGATSWLLDSNMLKKIGGLPTRGEPIVLYQQNRAHDAYDIIDSEYWLAIRGKEFTWEPQVGHWEEVKKE